MAASRSGRPPLLLEQAVPDVILPAGWSEQLTVQYGITDEAGLLERARPPDVAGIGAGLETVEPQAFEAQPDGQLDRLGCIAATPEVTIPDEIAEVGVVVVFPDGTDLDVADVPTALRVGDGHEMRGGIRFHAGHERPDAVERLLDPPGLQILIDLGVAKPGDVALGAVVQRYSPQAHAPAGEGHQ